MDEAKDAFATWDTEMDLVMPPALAGFLFTAFLIELTPGPNMTWLAIVALGEGRRAGFQAVAGVATGLAVIGALAALGLTGLIQASPIAWQVLRWSGIAFLVWLAWDGWKGAAEEDPGKHGSLFRRGLMTNLLNPKAAAFYVTVLPTFIASHVPAAGQTAVLTMGYVAVATIVHGSIVVLAGSLKPYLVAGTRERIVRRSLSVGLLLVAAWFAWSTAQPA